MHTVENNNVVEKTEIKTADAYASSSYSAILNSSVDSTKRKKFSDSSNRFYYTIGSHNFLFEKNLKVENLAPAIINKVPHTPDWCTGIISIRGVIMPVVNMHTLLNNALKLEKKYKQTNKPYLLMVEHENHAPVILQIDKLPEIINIKDYTYSRSANNSPNWQGKTWKNSTNKLFEIDHDKLFQTIKNN